MLGVEKTVGEFNPQPSWQFKHWLGCGQKPSRKRCLWNKTAAVSAY